MVLNLRDISDEHRRQIVKLCADEWTYKAVAEHLGVALHVIPAVLREEGVYVKRKDMKSRDEGKPLAEGVETHFATVCQWPIGEPGTKSFRFCGGPPKVETVEIKGLVTVRRRPYCIAHCEVAYVKL